MSESAREIFYLLSFSVTAGFFFSKTMFKLFITWQENGEVEKGKVKRHRP